MSMTSRERVLTAIHHEQPDRVPLVIGVSNATGIKMKPYQGIKDIAGIQAPDNYLYDWPELGTAEIDEETMLRLHSDVRGVLDLEPENVRKQNRERAPHSDYFDSWGSGQKEITPGDWFPCIHPLSKAQTVEDLDLSQNWPDMSDPTRIAHVRETSRRLAEENQFAILATPWLLFPFERALAMQGMESDHVDIIKIGDDLGTQESLMISPKMYREMLKPIHADFINFIKSRTKAKVLFHSDGDVVPLIEDFIEIGVDILNPIQTSAGSMSDLPSLKKRFGKNIVFCGGIDSHRILPFGSVEDVRQEVRRVIHTLGPGGGYLLGAVHTVMNDVPPENVLAMVDAVEEFGHEHAL